MKAICAFLISVCGVAYGDTNLPSRLSLQLTDGSLIIGTPTDQNLQVALVTEAMGTVNIPLTRVAVIEVGRDRESTVRLGNGDVLRGRLEREHFTVETLVGELRIPITAVSRLQVRAAGGRTLTAGDWDPLPFPVTCDWPGPQGQLSEAKDNTVEVRGHPIRTREALPFPFVWVCEVQCLQTAAGGADLNIFFFPPGTARDSEPPTTLLLSLRGRATGRGLELRPVLCEAVGDKRRSRELWHGRPQPFEVGKTYSVRVAFEQGKTRIKIHETEELAEGITTDFREAHIQLLNWQPTSRFLVQNPRAR